jgi:hypothetical protein
MKRLVPVLLLSLLVPACATNDESPTQPRPDLPATVPAPPLATVPPGPGPSPVPDAPPTEVIKLSPSNPIGSAPFVLQVTLCNSFAAIPGYPLTFTYDYGDHSANAVKGGKGVCRTQHTYLGAGNFKGLFCVADGVPGHKVCETINVFVN